MRTGSCGSDYSADCAYLGDDELKLTPMEYKLLCLLAKKIEREADGPKYIHIHIGIGYRMLKVD